MTEWSHPSPQSSEKSLSSAPLPFLHQPQRRHVRSHVCQRSFPVGSRAPLHLCLSSPFSLRLPTSSQEPLWHLTTKSTATGDGRTYGARDMMTLKRSSIWPAVNSCWRVSAGTLLHITRTWVVFFAGKLFLHFQVSRSRHRLSVLWTVFWVTVPPPADTTNSEMLSWLVFLMLAQRVSCSSCILPEFSRDPKQPQWITLQ